MASDVPEFSLELFQKFRQQAKKPATYEVSDQNDLIQAARAFGIIFVGFGITALVINIFLLFILLSNRKSTFSQVFYLITFNFVLIDIVKGVSCILFALKLLSTSTGFLSSNISLAVDQYSRILLRLTNLTTILNLALITLNEYAFICHPLRYHALITKKRIVGILLSIWFVATFFTICNTVTSVGQQKSLLIDTECVAAQRNTSCIIHQEASFSPHLLFTASLLGFCLMCLLLTTCCYYIMWRVASRIVKSDIKYSEELLRLQQEKPVCLKHGSVQGTYQMRRHFKYVLTIGTVILIYSFFLMAYGLIQILQLINMSSDMIDYRSHLSFHVKYLCYSIVFMHSILQPLCYLRIRKLRNLVKKVLCGSRREEIFSNT